MGENSELELAGIVSGHLPEKAPLGNLATCRSKQCRARIRWVETETGQRMPLDAEPLKVVVFATRGVYVHVSPWPVPDLAGPNKGEDLRRAIVIDAHRSHWETCPDAEKFRSGKRVDDEPEVDLVSVVDADEKGEPDG